MKKHTTRITALFLTLILAFSIACSGCTLPGRQSAGSSTTTEATTAVSATAAAASSEDNADFAAFTRDLFATTVSSDAITLHTFLQHPESYGITDSVDSLGSYDLTDDNQSTRDELLDAQNQLNSFDYSSLSSSQQVTWDELSFYLQNQLDGTSYYLLGTSLSNTTGIQVQLPLILSEYEFDSETDVTNYLAILQDTDRFFQNIVDYETLRSSNGYFMEDSQADEIITQCQSFIDSASDGYLLTTFDDRLAGLSSISSDAAAAYQEENATAVREHVIKGYEILRDGLTGLKGTNQYQGGICNYPNGKEYFANLLEGYLGWGKSVDEYNSLLDSYIKEDITEMRSLMKKDSTLSTRASAFTFPQTEPDAILQDLKSKITDEFPDGPDVDYTIKYVTKALADYASPAMYFTPQIDNIQENSIYINSNSTSDSDLYPTLAHEGYPGHMYQTTYFAATDPDPIRYLIEPGGYVEGWGTYAQIYAFSLAGSDAPLNRLEALNYAITICLYAKVDMGINYYGWTESNVEKYISNYGFSDSSIAETMYDDMVSDPGNYCKYALGYLGFCELKKQAENDLGSSFRVKEFHTFLMDLGPVPFSILEKQLPIWESNQSSIPNTGTDTDAAAQ